MLQKKFLQNVQYKGGETVAVKLVFCFKTTFTVGLPKSFWKFEIIKTEQKSNKLNFALMQKESLVVNILIDLRIAAKSKSSSVKLQQFAQLKGEGLNNNS
ncbi:CLUMA_CG002288, isoform A [Clunio marinus]|uniref:CLUMA_CG002288, isoform A n=1 Tax=Clunio marinus TaxID=568069 RepID=A0A1J1HLY1_9DIPT|nr:CLUMA_CG002288, isoform A [Clunio marinus]